MGGGRITSIESCTVGREVTGFSYIGRGGIHGFRLSSGGSEVASKTCTRSFGLHLDFQVE